MYKVEPSKIVLYPQLFWISIVLLSSDYVCQHTCAGKLLHLALSYLDLMNETTVNILLATAPGVRDPSPMQQSSIIPEQIVQPMWPIGSQALSNSTESSVAQIVCVQQLLLRGLLVARTEGLTVQLLTLFARHLAHPSDHFTPLDSTCLVSEPPNYSPFRTGITSLLGSIRLQITVTLVAIIPWVIMQHVHGKQRELVGEVCSAVAEACGSEGWGTLGMVTSVLGSAEQDGNWKSGGFPILVDLASSMCNEVPPW